MKLKETFTTCDLGDAHTMVAAEGFMGMVRGSRTAAFIIERLKQRMAPRALVRRILRM